MAAVVVMGERRGDCFLFSAVTKVSVAVSDSHQCMKSL